MANAWSPRDVKLSNLRPVTSDTATVISRPFPITAGGAQRMKVAIKLSGSNATGTLNINLQSAMGGNDTFTEEANVDGLTNANGWFYLDWVGTSSSLADVGRVEVDSAGTAQFTVEEVKILQED